MNDELTTLARFIATIVTTNNFMSENTPNSVAAGIIYFVAQSCHLNISKKNVNNCSEISEVTVNKCYKKLNKYKDQLIPNMILNKYKFL